MSAFYDDTIMCYSFSKSLSIPGERIGYVAVNPRCRDAETMVNMCGQISRGIGHNCPPSIIQLAVAKVLDRTADLSVYETNMEILYKELVDLGFSCVKPGGTFQVYSVPVFRRFLPQEIRQLPEGGRGIGHAGGIVGASLEKRFGLPYRKEHIFMASGAAGALAHAFRLVTEPGDEILTFAPYFPEYGPYVNLTGAV